MIFKSCLRISCCVGQILPKLSQNIQENKITRAFALEFRATKLCAGKDESGISVRASEISLKIGIDVVWRKSKALNKLKKSWVGDCWFASNKTRTQLLNRYEGSIVWRDFSEDNFTHVLNFVRNLVPWKVLWEMHPEAKAFLSMLTAELDGRVLNRANDVLNDKLWDGFRLR